MIGGMRAGYAQVPADLSAYTARNKQTTAYFATSSVLSLFDNFENSDRNAAYDNVWTEVKNILETVENAVSPAIPNSDIARYNALSYGETIDISSHTAQLFTLAKDLHSKTNGWFDPTVHPLVDLWGFTPRFNTLRYEPLMTYDRYYEGGLLPLPDARYIEALQKLVGLDKVVLGGNETEGYTLTKNMPSVVIDGQTYEAKIDFGGIAKGYAVDVVVAMLQEQGYSYGYFSNGGSSMKLMLNGSAIQSAQKDARFRVGIRKPRPGADNSLSSFARVFVENRALSTSGDYDHCYESDGIIISHIIDPFTGYPTNIPEAGDGQKGIATATIFHASATEAEGYSTALCAMPFEQAIDFINTHLKDEMVILTLYDSEYEFYEVVTNIAEDSFDMQDSAYHIASALNNEGEIIYTGSFLAKP